MRFNILEKNISKKYLRSYKTVPFNYCQDKF